MLVSLHISNYALIDVLDITFGRGLSIITGETGAGKSIVLGALSLLLGVRADLKAIRDKTRKTVVEAEFRISSESIRRQIQDSGILCDDGIVILRRELSSAGRSRTFVNDSPVSLSLLSDTASLLVDIHSQNKNLVIGNAGYRLSVLDAAGGTETLLNEYKETFRRYVNVRAKHNALEAKIKESEANEQFMRFQLSELDELSPRRGEQAELERKYEMLSKSEDIRGLLGHAVSLLSPSLDNSASDSSERALSFIERLPEEFFRTDGLADIADRLRAVSIELKDISEILEGQDSAFNDVSSELDICDARLNEIYRMQMNFKVTSEDELVDIHEDLRRRLQEVTVNSDELPRLKKDMRTLSSELKAIAVRLSGKRKEAASGFASEMMERGRKLGLKNLDFRVLVSSGKLTPSGGDTVDFLCSFNKNTDLRPVEKIASGGEMSRLMLSLKSIMAGKMDLPTIIFDEIDTGVSGEIADRMGEMMKMISRGIQVITITHLPQVAVKGDFHFRVYKEDTENETHTNLMLLDRTEREIEIARMLSGAGVNGAALMNARELLRGNTQ